MDKNNIKKFEEYNQDTLMNDLNDIEKMDEKPENFDPKEWEITSIVDIMTEDPNKSEDDRIGEIDGGSEVKEAITFDTQVPRNITRGSYIWITAMLERKGSSYNDPGRMGVIKLRCVDIYYGLSHLNKVINQ